MGRAPVIEENDLDSYVLITELQVMFFYEKVLYHQLLNMTAGNLPKKPQRDLLIFEGWRLKIK